MHFENFSSWFSVLIRFWFGKELKLTNLANWLNNQNHARAMKIRPKTEKLNMASCDDIFMQDHEQTCFIRFWDVFHEIWMKISFCNPWWKSASHGIGWKKKFEVDGNNVLSCEHKWEVWIFILRNFFLTQQTSMEWQILKTEAKSSLLLKILSKTLTLGLLSLYPKINGENEAHGVENGGLYKDRRRETQESLNNWFKTLGNILDHTINTQIRYHALANQ